MACVMDRLIDTQTCLLKMGSKSSSCKLNVFIMQARIRYNNIRFNVIKSTTRVGTSADSFALFPTLTITHDRVTTHENRTNST